MSTSRRNFLSLFPLLPVIVTLRRDKVVPLTANEIDDNFQRIVKEYERRYP